MRFLLEHGGAAGQAFLEDRIATFDPETQFRVNWQRRGLTLERFINELAQRGLVKKVPSPEAFEGLRGQWNPRRPDYELAWPALSEAGVA
nr:hypothetical protein [Verrucomicrobiota bacterium]